MMAPMIAAQRHHGHTHPHRLAGGGGAIIWKRIERDVDGAGVELEMGTIWQQVE